MRKRVLIFMSLLLAFANGAAIFIPSQQAGATVIGSQQVSFCHRDNNVKKPYGNHKITTSANAIIQAGHDGHDGKLAYSEVYANTLKKWGDIIPAFKYTVIGHHGSVTVKDFPGYNNTELGLAMIENNCQYVTTVIPADVTFTDASCNNSKTASYTINATTGVNYYVGDQIVTGKVTVAPGSTITITAKATSTAYFISSSTKTSWTYTFKSAPEVCEPVTEVVTPLEAKFTPPTCSALGYYTIPTVEGVTYYINNEVVSGQHSVKSGTTVTISAVADKGYEFEAGAPNRWTYTFTDPSSCGSVLGDSTVKPTALPATSGDSTAVTVSILSVTATIITVFGIVARSLFARRF